MTFYVSRRSNSGVEWKKKKIAENKNTFIVIGEKLIGLETIYQISGEKNGRLIRRVGNRQEKKPQHKLSLSALCLF